MSIPTQTLGPDDGTITVRTSREGRAARMGHDLVIDVTSWEARISDDGITFEVDPGSLVVREGIGGLKPLTDEDRGRIAETMQRRVLGGLPIAFRSSAPQRGADGTLTVEGDLELAGATRPLRAELHPAHDGVVRTTIGIRQTDWGITPHSAMMGALRVRDRVDVELEIRLSR